jgi:hypothetical protein
LNHEDQRFKRSLNCDASYCHPEEMSRAG